MPGPNHTEQVLVDRGLLVRMLIVFALLAVIYAGLVTFVIATGEGSVVLLVLALLITVVLVLIGPLLAQRALGVRLLAPDEYPELHERIQRLALLMGIPAPRLGLCESPLPNAFAIGYPLSDRMIARSVVVVTTRLVDMLEPEELDGVLAHELAHLRNRDAVVITGSSMLALASLIVAKILVVLAAASAKLAGLSGRLARWLLPAGDRQVGTLRVLLGMYAVLMGLTFLVSAIGALVLAALYWLLHAVSLLAVLALSRYREFIADRAAGLVTRSPAHLAAALRKIERASVGIDATETRPLQAFRAFLLVEPKSDWLLGLLSTHPPISQRVERLMELERVLARR
jgi:heat shock protein HtpX